MIPERILEHARKNEVEPIRRWLASGPHHLNEPSEGGITLLHDALFRRKGRGNKTELIKLLLANGADPGCEDDDGFTPLFFCAYPEEIDALLDGGADIDHKIPGALVTAVMWEIHVVLKSRSGWADNLVETARGLIRRGADLSVIDRRGNDAERLLRSEDFQGNRNMMLALADFIADVKRAGGWRRYLKEPRIELVRLRSLSLRGRATLRRATRQAVAPRSVLQRLFGAPPTRTPAASNKSARVASPVPREVFWHIFSYWKSARDED